MPKFRDPLDPPPPRRDEDDDREKPSWRELDARRDRGFYAPDKTAGAKKTRSEQADTLAKKALNQFFSGKKSKEQEKAWKHVCEASGKLFASRSKSYVEQHGMLRDWNDLLRLLDHPDPKFFETVLDRLMALVPEQTPVRLDLLVGKLRVLKITQDDPALLAKMDSCLAQLAGTN